MYRIIVTLQVVMSVLLQLAEVIIVPPLHFWYRRWCQWICGPL